MRIPIRDLKENMIIDEDIFTSLGSLVLSKGSAVNDHDKMIQLLKNNNIKKIKVLTLQDSSQAVSDALKEFYADDIEKVNEIRNFIEEFTKCVNRFESEVIENLITKGNKADAELLLEEAFSTTYDSTLNVFQLLQKLKNSSDVTFTHCNSVALMSYTIGSWMKMNDDDLKELSLAALFSDIGKYNIPKEILTKKGNLTFTEFEAIKQHVDNSVTILENAGFNNRIIDAVKFHHERADGSGYPYGLKGDQIPTFSKIIALADIFVALTSSRPYRNKYTPFDAIHILETDYMQKIDIVILSKFINKVASNYIGNPVKLSNGKLGEILFINTNAPLRPIIKISDTKDLIDLSSKYFADLEIEEFL